MDKYLVINLLAQIVVIGVNLVISFFFVPYATEVIGESSYGFVGLANDFVGYAQIITVAINSMAGRFIAIKMFEKRYDEANKYYSSVIISNLVISGVLFVIGLFFVIFIDKLVEVPASLLTDVRLLFSFIFLNFIITVITSTF
ncbi:MAG: oligosaccharide flippase family protein, partial [Erysipelotrichaceae bacterium]|nr:oligosaccharide flippase family protein [Erysipelotrichaceae bacterium]